MKQTAVLLALFVGVSVFPLEYYASPQGGKDSTDNYLDLSKQVGTNASRGGSVPKRDRDVALNAISNSTVGNKEQLRNAMVSAKSKIEFERALEAAKAAGVLGLLPSPQD